MADLQNLTIYDTLSTRSCTDLASNCSSASNMTSPVENCTKHTCSPGSGMVENPFIMVWYLQVIYIVLFVSMVIVAAGGNIIVIWIVLAHRRMRTVTNYFLVNLATADALISILNTLFNFVYMLHNDWPFGRNYCKVTQFVATCTISASVFTFMAIAIDRYVAIIHPMRPRMSATTVLTVIVVIWIASSAIAMPNMLYAEIHEWQNMSRTVCYLEWPDGYQNNMDLGYNIFLMLVNYVVPLVALAVTYTRVGLELWGSQAIGEVTARQEETIQSKRKVVRMMIVVVVIFAVCWLPQHMFFVITNRIGADWPYIQHFYLIIFWVAMSNSMYNPIIYCWMNARFRRFFMYVFRWLPCVNMTASSKPINKIAGKNMNMCTMSMSETSKYGNGSMNTHIEPLDESTYVSNRYPPKYQYKGLSRVKQEDYKL